MRIPNSLLEVLARLRQKERVETDLEKRRGGRDLFGREAGEVTEDALDSRQEARMPRSGGGEVLVSSSAPLLFLGRRSVPARRGRAGLEAVAFGLGCGLIRRTCRSSDGCARRDTWEETRAAVPVPPGAASSRSRRRTSTAARPTAEDRRGRTLDLPDGSSEESTRCPGVFAGVTAGVEGQRLARADFQKRPVLLRQQLADRAGESNGLAQVRAPVGRVRRLLGADPRPGHARHERDRRRPQADLLDEVLERAR